MTETPTYASLSRLFHVFKGAQKSTWLSRVASNFRGDDGTLVHPWVVPCLKQIPELSNTEAELSGLISLEENMASELRFLHQRYAESTFDRTWWGRLFVLVRHATGFYCIFRALIVRSCISCTIFPLMRTELTPSVPLKHSPSSPYPCHTNRLSPISGSHRFHPRSTHTAFITCNRGESYLCDPSDEPRACRRRHYRLYPACLARCHPRASCHPRVTASHCFPRFARTCSINGTCFLISSGK